MSAAPSRTAIALAVLLWLVVGAGIAIQILGSTSPDATAAAVEGAFDLARRAGIVLAITVALGMLLWPPVLPWLRLRWRGWREQSSVDQRPLLEARARLAHFENAADHFVVGRALLRMGSAKAAWPHLSRSLELDRQSAATWFEAGKAAARLGDLAAARGCLGSALALDARHAFGEARLLLARLSLDLHQPDAAERELEEHERLHGACREGDLLRTRALEEQGRMEEAKAALARARQPLPPGSRTPLTERFARAQALVHRLRGRR